MEKNKLKTMYRYHMRTIDLKKFTFLYSLAWFNICICDEYQVLKEAMEKEQQKSHKRDTFYSSKKTWKKYHTTKI